MLDMSTTSDIFPSLMITPTSTRNNPSKDIPVHSSYLEGSIAYVDKVNDHFIWDCDVLLVMFSSTKKKKVVQPCMMFSFASTSYDDDFPTLERKSHPETKIQSRPFTQYREVFAEGLPKPPSQAEEVLNWHTLNSRAQNQLLKKIDTKLDRVVTQTSLTDSRPESL